MLVGDDESFAVGGETDENRIVSCGELGRFAARCEIDDGDGVGAGVGDVGESSGAVQINRQRLAVERNCSHDSVVLGVDDRERAVGLRGAGVHDIDFVVRGVGGDGNRNMADGQLAIDADVDHVENRDGVAASVGYVDVLAVVGRVLREVVGAASGDE